MIAVFAITLTEKEIRFDRGRRDLLLLLLAGIFLSEWRCRWCVRSLGARDFDCGRAHVAETNEHRSNSLWLLVWCRIAQCCVMGISGGKVVGRVPYAQKSRSSCGAFDGSVAFAYKHTESTRAYEEREMDKICKAFLTIKREYNKMVEHVWLLALSPLQQANADRAAERNGALLFDCTTE